METTTGTETAHLRADIQKLKADIAAVGVTLRRLAGAGVREAAAHVCEPTEGMQGDAAGRIGKRIEDNLVATLVAALGLGFAFGRLCARRLRD